MESRRKIYTVSRILRFRDFRSPSRHSSFTFRLLSPLAMQVDRDLMIWNNKRYVSKPVLVKSMEDSLVQRHRRWYSQFYSEHSPRLKVTSDVEW